MTDIKETDAVILCGGLGKRLRSVNPDLPKVMVAVEKKPFLDITIGYLKKEGVRRMVFCTGYKAEVIEQYYQRAGCGLSFAFAREKKPLGTGGALKNAKEIITSDPFFCLNGDSFSGIDYQTLLDFHQRKNALATLVVARHEGQNDCGAITLDCEKHIVSFKEKDPSAHSFVSAGIYCFAQKIFSLLPDEMNFSLEYDCFPRLVGKGLYGYVSERQFFDIGTPDRYRQAQKQLKRKKIRAHK